MMRFVYSLIVPALMFGACVQLNHITQQTLATMTQESSLTEQEVGQGLKEALQKGCINAVLGAGKTNGFYKNATLFIPFPQEADVVKDYALKMGLNQQVADFEESMNRAAEASASKATDILTAAVKELTINDAWNILRGGENAATNYLKEKTSQSLYAEFFPVSQKAVSEANVAKYWNPLATAYNASTFLTGTKKVNPDLDKYITEKALDGLYLLISDEEKLIRKDPLARTTDLLRKVFAKQ